MLPLISWIGIMLASASLLASLYILGFGIAGSALCGRPGPRVDSRKPHFLILVPAHNEADGIRSTIESLLRVDYPRDRFRFVTIADNCEDDTARIAGDSGSEVWVRVDPVRRGKGQALSWAFARAMQSAFDLVVVIDADTNVLPGFLQAIAAEVAATSCDFDRVVFQGRYDFAPTGTKAGWFETFTIASKAAENSFVYRPRSAAGLVNLIQGNGFCIPLAVLERVPFAAGSVVEDAEYAIALALAGICVRYVDGARVESRMTRSIRDAAPQRLRWASGIFQLILSSVPRLLAAGIRQRSWKLIEGALMLVLSSRLVVLYATLAAIGAAVVLLPVHGAATILFLLAATIPVQAAYLWMIFRRSAEKSFPLRDLFCMPAYLGIVGLAQAAAFLGIGRKRWARTVR
jgi:cellulose synthase/poly-beta-1,6-N-acetylglucosamine synthase-like glycosyltransferase